jgi:hypothetical protein
VHAPSRYKKDLRKISTSKLIRFYAMCVIRVREYFEYKLSIHKAGIMSYVLRLHYAIHNMPCIYNQARLYYFTLMHRAAAQFFHTNNDNNNLAHRIYTNLYILYKSQHTRVKKCTKINAFF